MTDGMVKIKRALVSVSDKAGLEALARKLVEKGVEIVSSGGTGKYLSGLGIACTPVESITGNPEAFDGRMKTMSFQVSSALLYCRDNPAHVQQAQDLGVEAIDMVVCNLYPFEETAKATGDWAELIEKIDIGGPTMIRAAAKNHKHVCVVTNPAQYAAVIAALDETGGTGAALREILARDAFRHTARYDALIAAKLEEKTNAETRTIILSPESASVLRYGENPHQKAWVYTDPFNAGLAGAVPLQGKALSYNNLMDADAAWRSCGDIAAVDLPDFPAAVSIIKHSSPCGAARARTQEEALAQAWAGDPISSFGGIIAFNGEVSGETAAWLADKFVEVIIAPAYSTAAVEAFAAKKNLRLIATPVYDGQYAPPMVRSVSGGWLVQQEDTGLDDRFESVTAAPFPPEKAALAHFGVMASKHLKSNAIGLCLANDNGLTMIGAGMGNPNRVVSMKQAIQKAKENGYADLTQAVLISDAFFPFSDSIDLAREGGIPFIVQPGGSVKDNDVIQACNDGKVAMAMTGRRHFRH